MVSGCSLAMRAAVFSSMAGAAACLGSLMARLLGWMGGLLWGWRAMGHYSVAYLRALYEGACRCLLKFMVEFVMDSW